MDALKNRLRLATRFLRDHKFQIIGVLCVFVVILIVHAVFAGGGEKKEADLTETIGITLAGLMAWISQGVVKVIVLVLDVLIVPILRYNHFTDSQIIGHGWAIVRDIVNMFFIVVLLVIAFQTIFGVGRADWSKQVPRLLLMAVVINFSRTICGLIIDFGQVVMITFVNAIKDIAGGNFVQLFGLQDLYTFNDVASDEAAKNETGFGVFDILIASFLTLVLTFVVLGTVLTMAMLFAFRIVVLWVLIIMSPLAFFLGGAKGVIGPAEGYYSDWWKRFSGAVSLGPILTFFLWLALASVGANGIADEQGFDTTSGGESSDTSYGLITKAFSAPRMTSSIIALALLFAGIEISQQTASSIGGSTGALMKSGVSGIPGLSKSLARMSVGAAAGGSLYLGKKAAGAYGRTFFQQDAEKYREKIGKAVGSVGSAMAGSGIPGLATAGRAARDFGYKQVAAVETKKEERRTEALKGLTGLGADQLKELAFTKQSYLASPDETARIQAAQLKLTLDEKKRVGLKPEELTQITSSLRNNAVIGDLDDAAKEKFSRAADAVPSLAAVYAGKKKAGENDEQYAARQQDEIDKRIRTILASPAKMRSWGDDTKALSDPRVRKALRKEKTREGKTGEEYIKEEKAGAHTADLWNGFEQQDIAKRKQTAEDIFASYKATRARSEQDQATVAADPDIMASPGLATSMRAESTARLEAALKSLEEGISKLTLQDLKNNVVSTEMLADEKFFDAFTDPEKNKNLSTLTATNSTLVTSVNEHLDNRGRKATEAIGRFERNADTGIWMERSATGTRLVGTQRDMEQDPAYRNAIEEKKKIAQTRLDMGSEGPRAVGFNPSSGTFDDDSAEAAFKNLVIEKPEIVLKMGELSGAIGKAVADAISPEHIKGLFGRIRKEKPGSIDQGNLISTLDKLAMAVEKNRTGMRDFGEKMAEINHAKRRLGR